MAELGSGKNEQVTIRLVGISDLAPVLKDLTQAGKMAQNAAAQFGNTKPYQDLTKEMQRVAAEAKKMAQAIRKTGSASKEDFDKITASVKKLQAQFGKQGGFGVPLTASREALKSFKDEMNQVGVVVRGNAKDLSMAMRNYRTFKQNLHDTTKAGFATKSSIDALNKAGYGVLGPLTDPRMEKRLILGNMRKQLDSAGLAMRSAAKESQWVGRQMMEGITLPLGLIGAESVRTFMNVSKEMVQLKKVTEFKADYGALEKSIGEVAYQFGNSRLQVTALYKEIAALGVDGEENIKRYATAVEELAMVGGVNTADSMNFFRTVNALFAGGAVDTEGVEKTRDIMAKLSAVADETTLQLEDMAAAFPEVAPVMANLGFSAEGIASSLAGMYKRGIPATEAAHGLKFALQRLVNPTKDASAIIQDLGINFFDASGNAVDADLKIFQVAKSINSMSQQQKSVQLGEMFGLRQVARMDSYFQDIELGRKQLQQFAAGTIDATQITSDFARGLMASGKIAGAAQDPMARYNKALEEIQKDPSVAMKRIKTSFEEVKFAIGKALAPAVITLGEKLVELLEKFSNLPPGIQQMVIGFGALVAALGPARFMFGQFQHVISMSTLAFTKFLPNLEITPQLAKKLVSMGLGEKVFQMGDAFMFAGNRAEQMNLRTKGASAFAEKYGNVQSIQAAKTETAAVAQEHLQKALEDVTRSYAELTAAATTNSSALAANASAAEAAAMARGDFADVERVSVTEKGKYKITKAGEEAGLGKAGQFTSQSTFLSNVTKEQFDVMDDAAKGAAKSVANLTDEMADAGVAAAGMGNKGKNSAKLFSSLKGSLAGVMPVIGLLSIKILMIVAAVAAVAAVAYVVFATFRKNWDKFTAALQPGIDAVKAAFEKVKVALSGIGKIFTEVIGQLGTGIGEGEKSAQGVEAIGNFISMVLEAIAKGLEFVASIIEFLKPVWESFAYKVKAVIGFVASLLQGEWKNALLFALAAVYEFVRPAVMIFDFLAKRVSSVLSTILNMVSSVTGVLGKIPGLGSIDTAVKTARDALKGFSEGDGLTGFLDEKLRGLGPIFSSNTKKAGDAAKPAGKKAGEDIAEQVVDGFDQGMGDGGGKGAEIMIDWVQRVIAQIDKEIDRIRKSAMETFERGQEAALKVYDDRIKAIEDQEKAEAKLFKTQEYLEKKRELLRKRELDKENYRRERALAIYEGRFNDVRMLDLDEIKNREEYNKDLQQIEKDRQKDLLDEQRNEMKDRIKLEQEAAKARFDEQKKALEAYLELITAQTPLTVGEFQSMLDQINQLFKNMGMEWGDYGTLAMDRWSYVIDQANRQVIEDFRRSGKSAATAFIETFLTPEIENILRILAGGGGGGGGGGGTPSAATPEGGGMPEKAPETAGPGFVGGEKKTAEDEARALADLYGGLKYSPDLTPIKQGFSQVKIAADQVFDYYLTESGDVLSRNEMLIRSAADQSTAVAGISKEQYDLVKDTMKSTKKINEYWRQSADNILRTKNGWSTDILSQENYTTTKLIAYVDQYGDEWTEINGVIKNKHGETGKAITDESGRVTGILKANNQQVSISSQTTYQGARAVFQEMIDKGIKPGTVQAQGYVQKINDLGYAVRTLPNGKEIIVELTMNDEAFWRSAERVKAWQRSDEGKIMMFNAFAAPGDTMFRGFDGKLYGKRPNGTIYELASGGLVKAQKDGIMANIGEGGYDEYVITTDPKYRSKNIGYLTAAAAKLGIKESLYGSVRAAKAGMMVSSTSASKVAEYTSGGGDVYINVDTFIGEEEWFATMAKKYNMKAVPRQRKIEGQQKRNVTSYNDRYRLR